MIVDNAPSVGPAAAIKESLLHVSKPK
jgi:hypothetical protein